MFELFSKDKFKKSGANLFVDDEACRLRVLAISEDSISIEGPNTKSPRSFNDIKIVSFKDKQISLADPDPIICEDVIHVPADSLGMSYVIDAAVITQNDQNLRNLQANITVYDVSGAKGGNVTFQASTNQIFFSAFPKFKNVFSFCYKAEASSQIIDWPCTLVTLLTPHMPRDPYFPKATWLQNTNIVPAWRKYKGNGVKVTVLDPSMCVSHEDLKWNVPSEQFVIALNASYSHATSVSGVIAAQHNDKHTSGVAPNVQLSCYPLYPDNHLNLTAVEELLLSSDIVQNSWGIIPIFAYRNEKGINDLYETAIKFGRKGKGTIIVFSAGNDGLLGKSSNYDAMLTSPYTINVGGTGSQAPLIPMWGANILLSAPWIMHVLDIKNLRLSNSGLLHDDTVNLGSGTSFSGPTIAGITALMLEANSQLKGRDVQSILAGCSTIASITANLAKPYKFIHYYNGAANWNGGGRHFSHLFGFGMADAKCSVALAETWPVYLTYKNLKKIKYHYMPKGNDKNTKSIFIAQVSLNGYFSIEHITVNIVAAQIKNGDLPIIQESLHELFLSITSPSNTTSLLAEGTLLNQATNEPADQCQARDLITSESLTKLSKEGWQFGSAFHRGENANGIWSLTYSGCQVLSIKLTIYGSDNPNENQLIYTNEFSLLYTNSTVIKNGPILNAAAVDSPTILDFINLNGRIAGIGITIAPDHYITRVITGPEDDCIATPAKGSFTITAGCGHNDIYLLGGKNIIYFAPINCLPDEKKSDHIYGFNYDDKIIISKAAGQPHIENYHTKSADIVISGPISSISCTPLDDNSWQCIGISKDLQPLACTDNDTVIGDIQHIYSISFVHVA